jgi:hypothetical protein
VDPRDPPILYATPQELTSGSRGFAWPLPKVPGHFTIQRRYAVDLRSYVPLALDTPDVEFPEAFLVAEKPEEQVDNLLTFSRLYATIPPAWAQASSAIVDIPGISATPTFAAATSITATTTRNSDVQTLTAASHGLTAGDRVFLYVGFLGTCPAGGSSKWFLRSGDFSVISAPSSSTFKVALGPFRMDNGAPIQAVTNLSGSVKEYTAGYPRRTVRTMALPVTIERAYVLPGVTLGAPSRKDIALPQPFTIELGTEDAGTFPANTVGAATLPTAAQFWDLVQRRADLIASVELEEYLGNILCRKTTYWTAR